MEVQIRHYYCFSLTLSGFYEDHRNKVNLRNQINLGNPFAWPVEMHPRTLPAFTMPVHSHCSLLALYTQDVPSSLSPTFRVLCSSVGSMSVCCKAAPSSNLGSAPQCRLSTERTPMRKSGVELSGRNRRMYGMKGV